MVEIMDAVHADVIKGMYIMGENPAMSDPDLNHAREALAHLEHLVVQDLFLTETAVYADVVLPASAWPEKDGTVTNTNRQVQMGRQALPLPGDTRHDWWLIQELGRRIGLPWNYKGPDEIYTEMASLMPSLDNISWERVERESAVTYPADAPDKPGRDVVFDKGFPRPGGFGKLVAAKLQPPDETPDAEYPVHPHHRARARALAHRRHDAARHGARRDRAGRSRLGVARHHRQARHQAGRHDPRRHPPRHGRTGGAPGRRHSRRRGVHSRSPSSRRRRTCSPIRRSIRSAKSRSSSFARRASKRSIRRRGWRRSSRRRSQWTSTRTTRSCASKRGSTRLPTSSRAVASSFWPAASPWRRGASSSIALLFGAITFDPAIMACAAAALLGGFVAWGSNRSTANETARRLRRPKPSARR